PVTLRTQLSPPHTAAVVGGAVTAVVVAWLVWRAVRGRSGGASQEGTGA
ncbi:MAG: family hydrolase, partial [Oerskovia sp.]|nr:family hydrolase [Oerskovia sp.]